MTLTGSNFTRVTAVKFGTVSGGSISVASSTKLQVTAPAHAAGIVDVRVVSSYGTSAVVTADRYGYVAPPTVTAIAPHGGTVAGGTRVALGGTNFVNVSSVKFGTVAGTSITAYSTSVLAVTAPAQGASLVDIRVTTPYGVSSLVAADHYTFLAHTPPSAVTALRVSVRTTTALTLQWVDPPDVELTGVMVRRAVGTVPPSSPADGVLVADVAAPGNSVNDSGLTPATQYSYALFAHDIAPNYSAAVTKSVATSPTTGISWHTPLQIGAGLSFISCPSPTFCAGTDSTGRTVTFDGTSWSAPSAAQTARPLAISCASPTFCAALVDGGKVVTFDGSTWTPPKVIDPQGSGSAWNALSCTAPRFCAAHNQHGVMITRDGTTWTAPQRISTATVLSLSCASPAFCMAVDLAGNAITFDGTGWTSAPIPVYPAAGCAAHSNSCVDFVSCASSSFCVVASDSGSPAALFDGASWTTQSLTSRWMNTITCPAVGMCVLLERAPNGNSTTLSGGQWSPPTPPDPNGTSVGVSCATPTFCVAIAGNEVIVGT